MTVATLGTLAIVVLFLVALATAALALVGHARGSERLVEGAVHGMRGTFAVAAFASMLLIYAFLAGDYSIQYVQHNSEASMPVFYKITAFWGSLDGSLLFWVLLLSLFSWMAISANQDRHRDLIGPAVATLAVKHGACVWEQRPSPRIWQVPEPHSKSEAQEAPSGLPSMPEMQTSTGAPLVEARTPQRRSAPGAEPQSALVRQVSRQLGTPSTRTQVEPGAHGLAGQPSEAQ